MKVKCFEANAINTPLRLYDNRAVQVNVKNSDKSVSFLENSFQQVNIETDAGSIFVYDNSINGQWALNSDTGDIAMLSKSLPYNILVDLETGKSANVHMDFNERFWKKADVIENKKNAYCGSVGENPNKIFICHSNAGQINIGKRTRYSELDPFKDEYPYAKINPYVIERATKSK